MTQRRHTRRNERRSDGETAGPSLRRREDGQRGPNTEHPLVRLGRQRGNQAVQAVFRNPGLADLGVGPADDAHEREAARAATHVDAGRPVEPVRETGATAVQRQLLVEEEEAVPLGTPVGGASEETMGEPSEKADVVAVPGESEAEGEPVEAAVAPEPRSDAESPVLLSEAEEEEELVQRSASAAPPSTAPVGAGLGGPGRPLDPGTRSFFESRFGRGFGDVRVHTDATADTAARALGATAFTHGRDIYFRSGQYRPDDHGGRQLLAHELTHTVQQRAAATPPLQTHSTEAWAGTAAPTTRAGDTMERQADRAARRVAAGNDVRGVAFSAAARPVVARQVARTDPETAPPTPGEQAATAVPSPPPGEAVQLMGQGTLTLPDTVVTRFDEEREEPVTVRAAFGRLASGTLALERTGEGEYDTPETQALGFGHDALTPLREAGLPPMLAVDVERNAITGYVTVGEVTAADVAPAADLVGAIRDNPDALGWVGMDELRFPNVTNRLEGGTLTLSLSEFGFRLGGYLEGTGSFGLSNETVTFGADAVVEVPNLTRADLSIERDERGALYGDARVPVELANFQGTLLAEYGNGTVAIEGTVEYAAEKFSGSLTLLVTDEETARNVARAQLGAENFLQPAETEGGADTPARGPAPGPRAVAGYGTVEVHLTEWLAGQAQVVVNNEGHVTVVGEIRPPAEVVLFEQRDYIHEFPRLEVRALYGVPVVGNVFVFANIGLDAMAKLGPAKIYDILIQGQYSTDPEFFQNFRIAATLNVSAFAGLRLRGEGGAGVEVADHDIKAGVGVNALAGIRGYAEATPSVGYREQAAPEEGKVGEFFIVGHMEIAAQPFLGLGGDLFVELDSPWWSPAPDKMWTWPVGELEYPLPGEFGIGADFDYVLGSGEVPDIEFGEVNFDSRKFMTDLMNDHVPKGNNDEQETTGTFEDQSGGAPTEPEVASGQAAGGNGEVAQDPQLRGGGGAAREEVAQGQQDGRGDDRRSVRPEQPAPELVKAAALADVERRIGRTNLQTVEELEALIQTVYGEHRSNGLRSLDVELDEQSMNITIRASASDPEMRILRWEDAFADADEARADFTTQGWNETVAALSVDGVRFGEVVTSDSQGHAEQNLIGSQWSQALEVLREAVANGERPTLVLAINRAPCHTTCSPLLIQTLEAVEPELKEAADFVLAPTGDYMPFRQLTKDEIEAEAAEWENVRERLRAAGENRLAERFDKKPPRSINKIETTRISDLRGLVRAGWDLNMLLAREEPTHAGRALGQAAHTLMQDAERIRAGR